MIRRIDWGLAEFDLADLEAVQLSARQVLTDITPYLELLHRGRDDLQAFQLDRLLFYAVELVEGVLVDSALLPGIEGAAHQHHDEVQATRWWNRPFIVRITWDGSYGIEASHQAGQAAQAPIFPELAVGTWMTTSRS